MKTSSYRFQFHNAFTIRSSTGVEFWSTPWQYQAAAPVHCITLELCPHSDTSSSDFSGYRHTAREHWPHQQTHQRQDPGWWDGNSFAQTQKCLRARLIGALSDGSVPLTSPYTTDAVPKWLHVQALDLNLQLVMVIDPCTRYVLAAAVIPQGLARQALAALKADRASRLARMDIQRFTYQLVFRKKYPVGNSNNKVRSSRDWRKR